jgi:hypothetical protein
MRSLSRGSRRDPQLLWRLLVLALTAGIVLVGQIGRAQDDSKDDKNKKNRASLVLKATPPIAFSPARVVVSAELKGGSSDTDELYCPTLEWDWGDGTKSEATSDCTPFEAGKSTIERRWTASHTFQSAESYRVQLRLRRGTKTLVAGNIAVQVKPGVRDQSEF